MFAMYKFSFVVTEEINKKLDHLLNIAKEVKVDETGVTLYILNNNDTIRLNLSCFIDLESRRVKLAGWGACKNELILKRLSREIGIEIEVRKKKLSLLDFAKLIIELHDAGLKERERILDMIAHREKMSEEEINHYVNLLIDASKRRVVKREIKRAAEIIS